MTLVEREYRSLTNRIGGVLLIFIGLFNVFGFFDTGIGAVITRIYGGLAGEIAYSIIYDITYTLSFMLPVLIFYRMSRKHMTEPVSAGLGLPENPVLWLIAGLAVMLAAGYLNTILMLPFHASASYGFSRTWDQIYGYNHNTVLEYITIVIVPPFCEELFFRGMVLSNLRPYGKVTAVIGSAVLFGLMHQNGDQLFFATAAGIVLGILCIETKSVWTGILLHMFNNLFSITEEALYARLGYSTAARICSGLEAAILVVGLICIMIIISKYYRKRKNIYADGIIGKQMLEADGYEKIKLPHGSAVRYFFSPFMACFTVIAVLSIILLVIIENIGAFLYV